MTQRRGFAWALLIGAVLWTIGWGGAAWAEPRSLVILHTNDMHGHLYPGYDFNMPGEPKPRVGGMARIAGLARAVREQAEQAGTGFLLLDAGDVFEGTPEGLATRGMATIEVMNLAGYDAMTVGNHEFAHGVENLRALARGARFPMLACNIEREADRDATGFCVPWLIKETGGLRVAVIGVITPSTPVMNFPDAVSGLRFLPTAEQVAATLAQVNREHHPDVVVVLSHIGSQADAALARAVPGIPLIIGGHDHVALEAGMRRGESLICQTGDHALRCGRVDLTYDKETRTIVRLEATLVNLDEQTPAAAPEVLAKLETLRQPGYDEVIGRCGASCVQSRDQESRIGNLVTDAVRAGTGAAVAVMNNGGIRSGLLRGAVTRRDLFEVAPFPESVRIYTLKGSALRSLIESGADGTGGFKYELSGVGFELHAKETEGRRVQRLCIGDQPLGEDADYRVAVSEFFAQHGVRRAFFDGKPVEESGKTVFECLVHLFRSTAEVAPRGPGAMKVVSTRPTEADGVDVIDVNEADVFEWIRLPGVGETLAERIIAWRNQHGRFERLEQLLEVKGISTGLLEKLRLRLRVEATEPAGEPR